MCIKKLADQAWGVIHLTASFFVWVFKTDEEWDSEDVFDQERDRS